MIYTRGCLFSWMSYSEGDATLKLASQAKYVVESVKVSLRKVYGWYGYLINQYEVPPLPNVTWHPEERPFTVTPPSIRHYTKPWTRYRTRLCHLIWKFFQILGVFCRTFFQLVWYVVRGYRIAGNFCGVLISAILRFLSATAELKTAEYFYLVLSHPNTWPYPISELHLFYC